MENLQTLIKSKNKIIKKTHHFMPSLAIELALREGVPLNQNIVKKVKYYLKKNEEEGSYKWDNNYPVDYDDTITALNMLNLLDETKQLDLNFSFAEQGGIFTYKDGFRSKENNNVDLLINLRILDYLQNQKTENEAYSKLIDFLESKKQDFFKPVTEISKYYCSEGFLLYSLSKVSKLLNLNIDNLIDSKKNNFLTKSDIKLGFLANPFRRDLIKKFNSIHKKQFYLFQHPRLGLKFRNPFLEDIINKAADNKVNPYFNQWVSQVYVTKGKELYFYEAHATNLINLLRKYSINLNNKIIELGVGTGNFLEHMILEYPNILGVDKSKFMLEQARNTLKNSNLLNMNVKDLKINAKAIYSLNFIDLYNSGDVEFWTDTYQEAEDIIKTMTTQLDDKGFFFLHKNETKRVPYSFKLRNMKHKLGYNLKNIYLYQDEKIIYRQEFQKISVLFDEFNKKLNKLKLNKVDENNFWIMYQKKI